MSIGVRDNASLPVDMHLTLLPTYRSINPDLTLAPLAARRAEVTYVATYGMLGQTVSACFTCSSSVVPVRA